MVFGVSLSGGPWRDLGERVHRAGCRLTPRSRCSGPQGSARLPGPDGGPEAAGGEAGGSGRGFRIWISTSPRAWVWQASLTSSPAPRARSRSTSRGRGVVRYSPPARILTAHRPHIAFPPHTTSIATPSRWSETSRDQTELDGTGAARPATRIIAMPEVPEQGRRAHRAGQEEWGSRAGRARLLPGLRRGGRLAP